MQFAKSHDRQEKGAFLVSAILREDPGHARGRQKFTRRALGPFSVLFRPLCEPQNSTEKRGEEYGSEGRGRIGAERYNGPHPTMGTRQGISATLLSWYEGNRRDLPWRRRPTPYRVWVSEIMLQQTRVDTVVPYYRRFLGRFPSMKRLAQAKQVEVLALWSGLGYYRRARQLHAAAREVVERFRGRFPPDFDAALSLPGVGPYTAGAILSIAYNLPIPVLDGNVERVLSRVFAVRGDPAKVAVKRTLRELAASLIPPDHAGDFNQAMMELGALICSPLAPSCDSCPIAGFCRARERGTQELFPQKTRPRETISVQLGVALIRRAGRVLLECPDLADGNGGRNGGLPYLRGLWIPPAVETSSPDEAPTRLGEYLAKNWGRSVELVRPLGTLRHAITFRRFTVHVWEGRVRARSSVGRAPTRATKRWRWYSPEVLGKDVPVPSLTLKALSLLEE